MCKIGIYFNVNKSLNCYPMFKSFEYIRTPGTLLEVKFESDSQYLLDQAIMWEVVFSLGRWVLGSSSCGWSGRG